MGGEPILKGDTLLCKTICHNGNSHKLYYYDNTKLFRCFTDCGDSFDIYALVQRVKTIATGKEYGLPQAIKLVAEYFGYAQSSQNAFNSVKDVNFDYLSEYERIQGINLETKRVELKEYDDKILKRLPHPLILPWIKDNISREAMNHFEICYNPKSHGIVIPHRDIDGRLIGIRERTLIKENADLYGKYRPMKLGHIMYNHPLSFALYGLYQNQENIRKAKKAFVFEAEKSVLQYESMFGKENNIAVAICGSSFIQYQAWLLINLGVKEIVVGLDKQYQELNDSEHQRLVKNLKNIYNKYGHFVTLSYIFDKSDTLSYKASPTDEGKEKFLELYNNRVNLY